MAKVLLVLSGEDFINFLLLTQIRAGRSQLIPNGKTLD